MDINDKLPEFPRDDAHTPYIISVEEERVADQTTTDLNIAVDEDKDVNSVICYYIIGTENNQHLLLDKVSNEVTFRFTKV